MKADLGSSGDRPESLSEAVAALPRFYMNPENGHMVSTKRGLWVRYADVCTLLATGVKIAPADATIEQMCDAVAAMHEKEAEGSPYSPHHGFLSQPFTTEIQGWAYLGRQRRCIRLVQHP